MANEIKTTKKSLRINTIRTAAPRAGSNLPGNLLINSTPESPKWFSRREWRNYLIGAGLSADIPVMSFMGCNLTYDELVVTQEALDANGGSYKHVINGREIEYKKPGTNNINLAIDFSSVNVTESTINLAKLSSMFPRTFQQVTPVARPALQQADEIVNEPNDDIIPPADEEEKNTIRVAELQAKANKTDAEEAELLELTEHADLHL